MNFDLVLGPSELSVIERCMVYVLQRQSLYEFWSLSD